MNIDFKDFATTLAVGGYVVASIGAIVFALWGSRRWFSYFRGNSDSPKFTALANFLIGLAMLTVGQIVENLSDFYAAGGLPRPLTAALPTEEDLRRSVLLEAKHDKTRQLNEAVQGLDDKEESRNGQQSFKAADVRDAVEKVRKAEEEFWSHVEFNPLAQGLARRALFSGSSSLSEVHAEWAVDLENVISGESKAAELLPPECDSAGYTHSLDIFDRVTRELAYEAANSIKRDHERHFEELMVIDRRLDFARAMAVASVFLFVPLALAFLWLVCRCVRVLRGKREVRRSLESDRVPRRKRVVVNAAFRRAWRAKRRRVANGFLPVFAVGLCVCVVFLGTRKAYSIEFKEYEKRVFGFHLTIKNAESRKASGAAGSRSVAASVRELQFKKAVADALVADRDEVAEWAKESGTYRQGVLSLLPKDGDSVRVVSWMDNERARSLNDIRITHGVLWVTLKTDIKKWVGVKRKAGWDGVCPELRMEQLLGLPPGGGKQCFVTFKVKKRDLFRPIDVRKVGKGPGPKGGNTSDARPDDVYSTIGGLPRDAWFKDWFKQKCKDSYSWDGGYPWTRLGYTYDWGPGSGSGGASSEETGVDEDFGLTEFCVYPGAYLAELQRETNVEFLGPTAGDR